MARGRQRSATHCNSCCSVLTWLLPLHSTPTLARCSCPSGSYTGVESGASTCDPCPLGYFSPVPNTAQCTACGPGSYTAEPGQRACKLCAAGQVSATTATLAANADSSYGNATAEACNQCVVCPRRTFRPSIFAANLCTLCPAGRETRLEVGAPTCTACIPGTSLLAPNDVNCTACSPGEGSVGAGGRAHSHVPGAGCTCQSSAPHQRVPPLAPRIRPAGQFAEDQGMSGACPACPAGSAVSDSGNQMCDVCAPGTYQSDAGTLACIPW